MSLAIIPIGKDITPKNESDVWVYIYIAAMKMISQVVNKESV